MLSLDLCALLCFYEPSSCHTIEEDVIENRAHRLLFIWQSDLRVQWRRINSIEFGHGNEKKQVDGMQRR